MRHSTCTQRFEHMNYRGRAQRDEVPTHPPTHTYTHTQRTQLDRRMRDHGDMFVARCIALFSDVINNRLYERVRERGGLVYSVDLSFDPLFYADTGFFVIGLAPFPDKMDLAIQLVQSILADVQVCVCPLSIPRARYSSRGARAARTHAHAQATTAATHTHKHTQTHTNTHTGQRHNSERAGGIATSHVG